MKPDISVIVPVYNVEPYLPRCLDSLCAQDFQNVEFLLVDDGSPDNCGTICDRYAQIDSRFQVFHKENGGLSSARNYALDRATGRYVMFVDSDDWVTPDFCSTALKAAEQNKADIIMFAYQKVKGKRYFSLEPLFPEPGCKSREEAIELLWGPVSNAVWNKLYNRELFREIRFPERRLYEDVAVTHQIIYKANTIYYINRKLYYYFIRNNSISRHRTTESMQESFEMNMYQVENLKRYGFSEEKIRVHLNKLAMEYAIFMKADSRYRYSEWAYQTLRTMQKMPAGFSWKRKVMFRIYKVSPKLFDLCCVIWGKRVS